MELGALMERTRASREVVRTEIWIVNKRLFKEGLTSPQGAYATARFYKNKKGNEGKDAGLTGFEEGVHLERISQDPPNERGNYSVVYPDGVSTPYNRIEMNYYDEMIDLIQPVDLTIARQAFPDYDEALLKELLKQLDHSGAVSKTEVWKRLDSIGNEYDLTGVTCSASPGAPALLGHGYLVLSPLNSRWVIVYWYSSLT